jgi:prephenate dehydratase
MMGGLPYSIAYQGVPGAFSHQAAQSFALAFLAAESPAPSLALSPSLVPCGSFEEICRMAAGQNNCFACLPVENSSVGRLGGNYSLVWDLQLNIYAELSLPVHHQLLAPAGAGLDDIEDVYSHPVALEQCRRLFRERPNLRPQVYSDTASAAEFVKEDGGKQGYKNKKDEKGKYAAAIASCLAATEYGLEIIARDIEDFPQNCTRFVLLGGKPASACFPLAGLKLPYKLSVAIEPGDNLNQIAGLAPLLGDDFRLVKIEALPRPEHPWQCRLFLDFSILNHEGGRLAGRLMDAWPGARVLGRYNSLTV